LTSFLSLLATELVYPWKPWEDMEEPIAYTHVTGRPAREIFGPVIDSYRKLDWMGPGDGHVDFMTLQDFEHAFEHDWRGRDRAMRQWVLGDYVEWQAL
jgi:hypothetical protein